MAGRRPETDGATRAAPATEPVATRAAARGRHWPRCSPTATSRSRFDLRLAGSRTLAAATALKNEPSLNSRPEYTTGATDGFPCLRMLPTDSVRFLVGPTDRFQPWRLIVTPAA